MCNSSTMANGWVAPSGWVPMKYVGSLAGVVEVVVMDILSMTNASIV